MPDITSALPNEITADVPHMAPTFVLTGTPHGRWRVLADQIRGRAGVGVHVEVKDCTAAMAMGTRVIGFVDGPARAVAMALEMHAAGDPSTALQAWCEGAQHLLRQMHAQPSACLLVDVEESACEQAALTQLLLQRFGGWLEGPPDADALPEVHPVTLALTAGFVSQSRRAQALYAELQASSVALAATDEGRLSAESIDFAAAIEHWRESTSAVTRQQARLSAELSAAEVSKLSMRQQVEEAQRRIRDLQSDVGEVLEQLHRTQSELEGLLQEHSKLRVEKDALDQALVASQAALDEARNDSSALQQELRLSKDRLDTQFEVHEGLLQQHAELRLQKEASDKSLVTLQKALDKALGDASALQQELNLSKAQLDRLIQDHERLRLEHDMLQAEGDAGLKAAQRECDLLLEQLHTVQEELTHHFLAVKALKDASPRQADTSDRLDIGDTEVTGTVHDSPHHHLQFELVRLRADHRELPRVTVRLVEHAGRPGLVLMAHQDHPPPLSLWQPNGLEAGRALMVLVPTDLSGRRLLEPMATGDWQLVNGIVAHLRQTLSDSAVHPEAARWRSVAARLQRQLADLPPRLRYGALNVSASAGSPGGPALEIVFGHVVFGHEARPDLHLRWNLGAPSTVALQLGEDLTEEPPLSSWPVNADGQADRAFTLPVGSGFAASEKRRRWAALSERDRSLLLALLDALPACAERVDAATVGHVNLADAGNTLFRDARSRLRQIGWRRAVRALLRRGRGG